MKFIYYLLIAVIFILIGWFGHIAVTLPKTPENPISQILPRPLEKYSFDKLASAQVNPTQINIGEILKEDPAFTSYLFSFNFDPTLSGKEKKKVTGVINVPKGKGPFPIVVLFRGFVDQTIYKSGDGTRRAGEYFAERGYITIAPDFLGYGGSDKESENIFESRFQTYTTALTLLKSLDSIKDFDKTNIFLWGHSNGGHLAIATLEITGNPYPTVLWAPNSAKFPYSILYYLDEASDEGKLIITKLADFMANYDVKLYSIRNFFNKIHPDTKIQLHQGFNDDAIPIAWSDSLEKSLSDLDLEVSYIKYPGADHNLNPSWAEAVQKSLTFFQRNLILN